MRTAWFGFAQRRNLQHLATMHVAAMFIVLVSNSLVVSRTWSVKVRRRERHWQADRVASRSRLQVTL